jgi:hypothetical protein
MLWKANTGWHAFLSGYVMKPLRFYRQAFLRADGTAVLLVPISQTARYYHTCK